MRKTAIVVPCYNEERRLRAGEFLAFASSHGDVSFIFVNDGSIDGTGRVLKEVSSRAPGQLLILDLARNSGKAEAVRRGFLHAFERGFDNVGFWDADLATPLSSIPEFILMLETGKDVVLGSRVKLLGRQIERRAARHYLGRIFAIAVSNILKLPVYDTQCGAKLFRRTASLEAAVSKPFNVKWPFDVELLGRIMILEEAYGNPACYKRWVELPLQTWMDVRGSKVTAADFMKSGAELLKLARFFHSAQSRKRYVSRLLDAAQRAPGALKGSR